MCGKTQDEKLVHSTDVRIIWITLPGADRSYALSSDQAYQLLHELEETI